MLDMRNKVRPLHLLVGTARKRTQAQEDFNYHIYIIYSLAIGYIKSEIASTPEFIFLSVVFPIQERASKIEARNMTRHNYRSRSAAI